MPPVQKQISYKQEILRKTVHLSSLWMVAAIYFFPRTWLILLFGGLLVADIFVEYGFYKSWRWCRATYGFLFSKMLRIQETGGFHPSGAPYVLAAALLVTICFPKEIAMFALSVMLLSDTAAALVGRRFGRHKINEGSKSLEGAAAFFAFALLTLLFFGVCFNFSETLLISGVIAVLLADGAEVYEKQIGIDDNLSIPLTIGLVMQAAVYLSAGF